MMYELWTELNRNRKPMYKAANTEEKEGNVPFILFWLAFVFPKVFYIYTFHSFNLVLSIVYSQPLISEVVVNNGSINAKEFWPSILFNALNIKCLAVEF